MAVVCSGGTAVAAIGSGLPRRHHTVPDTVGLQGMVGAMA